MSPQQITFDALATLSFVINFTDTAANNIMDEKKVFVFKSPPAGEIMERNSHVTVTAITFTHQT